mmetsp:Transcript_87855/g.253380  ORF Transcript_87855/g.253380 Transcript_87855/m.253380 type:complete len:292 (+) Transcript_87855:943-1818(+)
MLRSPAAWVAMTISALVRSDANRGRTAMSTYSRRSPREVAVSSSKSRSICSSNEDIYATSASRARMAWSTMLPKTPDCSPPQSTCSRAADSPRQLCANMRSGSRATHGMQAGWAFTSTAQAARAPSTIVAMWCAHKGTKSIALASTLIGSAAAPPGVALAAAAPTSCARRARTSRRMCSRSCTRASSTAKQWAPDTASAAEANEAGRSTPPTAPLLVQAATFRNAAAGVSPISSVQAAEAQLPRPGQGAAAATPPKAPRMAIGAASVRRNMDLRSNAAMATSLPAIPARPP